jgi:hypothetical protein
MIIGRREWVAGAAIAAVLVTGGVVAAARGASAHTPPHVAAAPALTATERRELVATKPLIDGLQKAIDQVPIAASAASHGRVSVAAASRRIASNEALHALTAAGPTITLISSAYDAALSGGSIPEVDRVSVAVNQLSAIEGDLVPAVRVGASSGQTALSSTAAATEIESDRKVADLAALVENWSELYGSLTLVEQAAPQA